METPRNGIGEKKTYEKPLLRKHGNLKEITAFQQKIGSAGGKGGGLGCTRL